MDEYGNDFEPFIGIPKLIEILSAQSDETVIYEGVGVFDSRFDLFSAFKIFVDTPALIRKERAESRDVPTDERSAEDWKKIYDIWKEAEEEYFTDEIKNKAQIIVGEDGDFE